MLVCSNCNHSNPDGATQCEACYTPLPTTKSCPNCGASVQTDASFCGQCGFNLPSTSATAAEPIGTDSAQMPDLVSPDPLVQTEPLSSPSPPAPTPVPATVVSAPDEQTTPPPQQSQAVPVATRKRLIVNVCAISTPHIFNIVSISLHSDIGMNPRDNLRIWKP